MTYPIFLCRGVGLPTNDVDGALSEESHIPFGASTPSEAAADWVRAQVHPVHGSLSVFAVEVIPHNPGGVDGEAQCYVVRRLPDGKSMIGTPYTDEVAAEMVAAAMTPRQRAEAFMARVGPPPPIGFLAGGDPEALDAMFESVKRAADEAELDANYEEACHLTDSALREAHEGDDDEV